MNGSEEDSLTVGGNLTTTVAPSHCVNFTQEEVNILKFHKYYIEGVGLCAMAGIGMLANGISMFILNK